MAIELASILITIDTKSMQRKPQSELLAEPENLGNSDLLPNFCDSQVLLVVLLVAEALAIVLTLVQAPALTGIWVSLGKTSSFILVIALIDVAVLCFFNKHLQNLTIIYRSLLLYLVLQLVTACVTILTEVALLTPGSYLAGESMLTQALIRNLSISLIVTGVMLRYFYVHHQNSLRQRGEALARIQALQARIRPHFLFNSLNTVASLVHQNPDKAEEAILDLAELFRSTLTKTSNIALSDEIDIVNRYLHIEQLRLGDRLQVKSEISDAALNVFVPALLIQPLVENAVYHGIEPLPAGGTISITAHCNQNRLVIEISNPIDLKSINRRQSGNQLALDNIRQRLALAYTDLAKMELSGSDSVFCVTLNLPIRDNNHANSSSR